MKFDNISPMFKRGSKERLKVCFSVHFFLTILFFTLTFQNLTAQICGTINDWNLSTEKLNITATTTISHASDIANLCDGVDGGNNFYYHDNKPIANEEVVKYEFLNSTLIKGFEIMCSGKFMFAGAQLIAQGSDDDINWTDLATIDVITPETSTAQWGGTGTVMSFPFLNNTAEYKYYRLFGVTGTTESFNWVRETYFNYAFTPINFTNLDCSNNGTIIDVSDDYLTFDLNPTFGTGTYSLSVSAGSVTPNTASFNSNTSFQLQNGSAGGGNVTVTLTDATNNCVMNYLIEDPGNCLPSCGGKDWNLLENKSQIITTIEGAGYDGDPMGLTDGDLSTEINWKNNTVGAKSMAKFQFPEPVNLKGFEMESNDNYALDAGAVLIVEGSNDNATWTALGSNFTFSGSYTAGQYGSTGMVMDFPFTSNEDDYIYYRLQGVSGTSNWGKDIQEVFFNMDVKLSGFANFTCNNGGTFFDITDDFLTFDLNPTPDQLTGTGQYTIAADVGTITPATANFGSATSFNIPVGSAGQVTLNMIDINDACKFEELVIDPGNCLPGACGDVDWNLVVNKLQIISSGNFVYGSMDGDPMNVTDGDLTTEISWKNNQVAGNDMIKFQFPWATVLKGFELESNDNYAFDAGATLKVEGSNNDVSWTDLTGDWVFSGSYTTGQYGSTGNVMDFPFTSNEDAYIYYRLRGYSGTSNWAKDVQEVFFNNDVALSGITNVVYLDNGTSTNLTDDSLSFDLTPSFVSPSVAYDIEMLDSSAVTPTSGISDIATTFKVPVQGGDNLDFRLLNATDVCIHVDSIINPACFPDYDVFINNVTCNGIIANADGTITLNSVDANVTKVAYVAGGAFFGIDYVDATDVTGTFPLIVTDTLSNPDYDQPFTVRLFCDATNYTDTTVLLTHQVCSRADLSVQITPSTNTANVGEHIDYEVTLNNAGPDPAIDVEIKVDIPINADFLTATASLGNYSPGDQTWTVSQLPLGNQILTITYKVK